MGQDTREKWLQEIGPELTGLDYEFRLQASAIEEIKSQVNRVLQQLERTKSYSPKQSARNRHADILNKIKRLKLDVEDTSHHLNNNISAVQRTLQQIEELLYQ